MRLPTPARSAALGTSQRRDQSGAAAGVARRQAESAARQNCTLDLAVELTSRAQTQSRERDRSAGYDRG